MTLKSRIEAVLFLTDKPVRAQAVARIVNEDVQVVRQLILELIHDYESRDTGMEVADDDGYIIQVKDEYASIIDEFVPMELPASLLRTLSAIAIKQPVPQSEIIKIRGAGAYDHIKELAERELISKKEDGRSPLLSTTKKFQEYFRLSQDGKSHRHELKTHLEDLIGDVNADLAAVGTTEQLSIEGITPGSEGAVETALETAGTPTESPIPSEIAAQTDLELSPSEASNSNESSAEIPAQNTEESETFADLSPASQESPVPTNSSALGEFDPGNNTPEAFASANEILA